MKRQPCAGETLLAAVREALGPDGAALTASQAAAWSYETGRLTSNDLDEIAAHLGVGEAADLLRIARRRGADDRFSQEQGPAAPFMLANDPPRKPALRFENNHGRQMMLLAGLDCLPGQGDLFATDGEETEAGKA